MSQRARFDPDAIFAALTKHDVRFVVIGGLAGAAQGAGWPTFDVDILIETGDENLERLRAALHELGAEYDTPHDPPIRPDARLLRISHGPQLFRTKHGRLDVLKEAGGETYETLTRDAVELEVRGQALGFASLPALLRMKRSANRSKDHAAIARIEQVLRAAEEDE